MVPCLWLDREQHTVLGSEVPPGLCRLALATWPLLSTYAKPKASRPFQARVCTVPCCSEPSLGKLLPSLLLFLLPFVEPVAVITLCVTVNTLDYNRSCLCLNLLLTVNSWTNTPISLAQSWTLWWRQRDTTQMLGEAIERELSAARNRL